MQTLNGMTTVMADVGAQNQPVGGNVGDLAGGFQPGGGFDVGNENLFNATGAQDMALQRSQARQRALATYGRRI